MATLTDIYNKMRSATPPECNDAGIVGDAVNTILVIRGLRSGCILDLADSNGAVAREVARTAPDVLPLIRGDGTHFGYVNTGPGGISPKDVAGVIDVCNNGLAATTTAMARLLGYPIIDEGPRTGRFAVHIYIDFARDGERPKWDNTMAAGYDTAEGCAAALAVFERHSRSFGRELRGMRCGPFVILGVRAEGGEW